MREVKVSQGLEVGIIGSNEGGERFDEKEEELVRKRKSECWWWHFVGVLIVLLLGAVVDGGLRSG